MISKCILLCQKAFYRNISKLGHFALINKTRHCLRLLEIYSNVKKSRKHLQTPNFNTSSTTKWLLCQYFLIGRMSWRQIRAIHDETTVCVYQAYSDRIADAAVAANSFQGALDAGFWSPTRMSWVKPSAVWMAYRCGWTTLKDDNQRR